MVEQTEFTKEQLKNKRFVKGTPLYKLASRYGKYFAITVGCIHVSILSIEYFADIPEEVYKSDGTLENRAIQMGFHNIVKDTDKLEYFKEDFRDSKYGAWWRASSSYIGSLSDQFFNKTTEEEAGAVASSTLTKEVPAKPAGPVVRQISK